MYGGSSVNVKGAGLEIIAAMAGEPLSTAVFP
jgi:hypothetical protein